MSEQGRTGEKPEKLLRLAKLERKEQTDNMVFGHRIRAGDFARTRRALKSGVQGV